MKKSVLILMSLCIVLVALPSWGQGRHGMMGGGMIGGGYGMGPGMMGSPVWLTVPEKLLPPKNEEWIAKLRELLTLEEKAFDQYAADQDKYNAAMPYMMVLPQEDDHVETLQRLMQAYGFMTGARVPGPVADTKSLTEALELAVKTEEGLIPRYLWLVQKAEDRVSAQVLNRLLLQTRIHLAMFQHAVGMGGQGMGTGMMGAGYGFGPGMMGMTPGRMKRSFLGACEGIPYIRPDKTVDRTEAKMLLESCIQSTHNPNLKLGQIKDRGADFEASIVTKSNVLIDRILMDKKTGWMRSAY